MKLAGQINCPAIFVADTLQRGVAFSFSPLSLQPVPRRRCLS